MKKCICCGYEAQEPQDHDCPKLLEQVCSKDNMR